MALKPPSDPTEEGIKTLVQTLFTIQNCIVAYSGPPTANELVRQITLLISQLQSLSAAAASSSNSASQSQSQSQHQQQSVQQSIPSQTNGVSDSRNNITSSTLDSGSGPGSGQSQSQDQSHGSGAGAGEVLLPLELVAYVESARNPDIYTREFVELVQRGNAYLRGKGEALGSFAEVLRGEILEGWTDGDGGGGDGGGGGWTGDWDLSVADRGGAVGIKEEASGHDGMMSSS